VSDRGRSGSRSQVSGRSEEGSDIASVVGRQRGGGSDVCSERGAGDWDDYIERDGDDRIDDGEDDED